MREIVDSARFQFTQRRDCGRSQHIGRFDPDNKGSRLPPG